MATRERIRDRADRRVAHVLHEIGSELREQRLSAGQSQQHVANVAGLSQARVSDTELGRRAAPRVDELVAHAAVLGMRLSVRLFPEGSPVRDAGQLRLIHRLRPHVHGDFRWQLESPVGTGGDLRAWDIRLDLDRAVGIDAETRLRDIQAVLRRCQTRKHDSAVFRMLLLVADTAHNRSVLRDHRTTLVTVFPGNARETLACLRRGVLPPHDAIVTL